MEEMEFFEAGRREIRRLHNFFVKWFGADIDQSDENFKQCSQVLAHDFLLISPDGEVRDFDQISSDLHYYYGFAQSSNPAFHIEIEKEKLIWSDKQHLLINYEEWLVLDGQPEGRVSTVFMRRNARTPERLEWVHLHETALPDSNLHPKPQDS